MNNYESLITNILEKKKQLASPNSYYALWLKWYRGKVPSFHNYCIYNGSKKIKMERLTMHMAKKCCEDWASLLMNEKVSIGVESQDLLDNVLMDLNFYNKTNKSVEYAFALSMAGLTVEVDNLVIEENTAEDGTITKAVEVGENTKINFGVYSANKIVPITFENGEVVECAFIQENTNDKKITAHLRNNDGTYRVVVMTTDENGNYKDAFEITSDKQLFAIVHPQIVNNIDIDSPYPISIFANAIDTLKAIDLMFDSYANEFNLGRKRIFVSSEMDKVSKEDGSILKFFDANDIVIHQLPPTTSATGEQKPLIQEINGQLRTAEHSQAIQDLLNFFSSQVELGVDYYRFEKGRVMTATQVISEKSDTFRNLKKHEGVFEKALHTIIKGLMYAHNEFTMSKDKFENIETVKIHFDDSIIEDKATEKTNDMKDIELGVMSLVAYRMKWFAEDEETAQEEVRRTYGNPELIKRLTNFTPFLTQGTMTPLEFVKNVYIDIKGETEQNELAEEIAKSLNTGNTVFDGTNIYNPQE